MSNAAWARDYMTRWMDAANRRDLETLMTLYAPQAELISPVVIEIMKEPSGRIQGIDMIRDYFSRAFASVPDFHYRLLDAAWAVSSLNCWYVNHKGSISAAFVEFDAARKIIRHVNHFVA